LLPKQEAYSKFPQAVITYFEKHLVIERIKKPTIVKTSSSVSNVLKTEIKQEPVEKEVLVDKTKQPIFEDTKVLEIKIKQEPLEV
jgi:Chromo shadow domain